MSDLIIKLQVKDRNSSNMDRYIEFKQNVNTWTCSFYMHKSVYSLVYTESDDLLNIEYTNKDIIKLVSECLSDYKVYVTNVYEKRIVKLFDLKRLLNQATHKKLKYFLFDLRCEFKDSAESIVKSLKRRMHKDNEELIDYCKNMCKSLNLDKKHDQAAFNVYVRVIQYLEAYKCL